MNEIELKFDVPPGRLAALEKEVRTASAIRTHLVARYFDTPDGALARNRIALRLRKEGRRWVQTLKAIGDGGPMVRLEHNVDLGMSPASSAPAVDAARHRGTPAGDRLDAVLAESGQALIETFCTDIWRIARLTRVGGATVELALDTGEVYAPEGPLGRRQASSVCELELELVKGPVSGLVAAASRWRERHGLWLSTQSKAERGERVCAVQRGLPLDVATKAAPMRPPRDLRGGEQATLDGPALQRAVLTICLDHLLPNASEVAGGNEAEDVIHQLRVAIRRTRTALRELEVLAPGAFDSTRWEPPLVEAFRCLGAQRDQALAKKALQPRLEAAGAPPVDLDHEVAQNAVASRGDPAKTAAEVARDPAFQAALVDMLGFCAGVESRAADVEAPGQAADLDAVRAVVRKRLNKLHRQVVRDGRRFESLPVEAQHRVRKRAKRLRYLSEFAAPLFPSKKLARYLKRLLPAQDELGAYNDQQVAHALYRKAVDAEPHAWYVVGWLDAQMPVQARACCDALARLSQAKRFWKG
ncbi:CYTH and CHAD domain-containing protein [Variovorax dokdonensis]|uniref:CYTH and CHAD domain-containing protein n=1 Tax=Variovorax dokdonensis TaxID=344883 RepID=A0ABT7N5R0_9BURK|nr:CYTH and CHAD domain-containing protein [Variovorax dokdonensis]MDM0043255.1 CYTH and CHAD domain-containing protein [Variovorax dokdonensis]